MRRTILREKQWGIIYLITNKINNKRYVGLTTKPLSQRWSQHVYDALHEVDKYPLHAAIRKYGIKNFTIQKIDEASNLEELKNKERYWIKELGTYQTEYNATEGGDTRTRNPVGYTKISIITGEILKQYPSALECNEENGESSTRKADMITSTQYLDYVIVKTANIEGKTQEEIRNYAFSLRPKIICQLDKNNNIIRRWINSSDLLEGFPQVTKSCVFACLWGKRKTHLGYQWKYYQDLKEE